MAIDHPSQPSTESKRTLWQRRVVDPIVAQLTQGITPEKIALTIAVGSALANFPFFGTATLCLLVGIALRLNQPIIQAVNILFTPIHLVLIPIFFERGNWLFGVAPATGRGRSLEAMWNLFLEHPNQFFNRFGLLIFHAAVVWTIVAPIWIATVYYSMRTTLREVARVREEAARAAALKVAASKLADPTNHPVP